MTVCITNNCDDGAHVTWRGRYGRWQSEKLDRRRLTAVYGDCITLWSVIITAIYGMVCRREAPGGVLASRLQYDVMVSVTHQQSRRLATLLPSCPRPCSLHAITTLCFKNDPTLKRYSSKLYE